MDVQDGFIVGVFNHCDRWCERCEFTSRCRVFAEAAEFEASRDPGLKALLEAPPRWLQEMIDETNRIASEGISEDEIEQLEPKLVPEHERISARAHHYSLQVHGWLRSRSRGDEPASDPRALVGWFHTLIPAKIHRALTGLAQDPGESREWPADHDGSAKVALLGIEQSHAAWLELVARGLANSAEVQSMVADLVWLGGKLERVFPRARAFVRPAFDEPDEVARMLAAEGGR